MSVSLRAVPSAPLAQCRQTFVRMKLVGGVGCVMLNKTQCL